MPKNKKFAKITPIVLSRNTIGRNVKMTPEQEQIIFNKIACIILNRKNLLIGTDPREHTINTQTINIKIGKLFC
jgi:hypothetical protein